MKSDGRVNQGIQEDLAQHQYYCEKLKEISALLAGAFRHSWPTDISYIINIATNKLKECGAPAQLKLDPQPDGQAIEITPIWNPEYATKMSKYGLNLPTKTR